MTKFQVESRQCCVVRAYGRNKALFARASAGGLAGIQVVSSINTASALSLTALAVCACFERAPHAVILSESKLVLLWRARRARCSAHLRHKAPGRTQLARVEGRMWLILASCTGNALSSPTSLFARWASARAIVVDGHQWRWAGDEDGHYHWSSLAPKLN